MDPPINVSYMKPINGVDFPIRVHILHSLFLSKLDNFAFIQEIAGGSSRENGRMTHTDFVAVLNLYKVRKNLREGRNGDKSF